MTLLLELRQLLEAQADGSILVTTPFEFANSVKDAAILVPYFYNEGCELTGDVKEVAAPATRAEGAVSTDIQAAFLANAAKALNKNAGFVQKVGYAKNQRIERLWYYWL